MLTDRCRELLAAYVDGELTARQHKALLRLLQRSAEARDLLRRMQQDAEALRQLPRQQLDRDLSAPVVRIIAERRLQPGGGRRRRTAERRQPNFPAWAGFSAAAAALLLVALGSYVYFSASMNNGPNEDAVAKGKGEQQPVKPPVKPKNDGPPTPEPKKEQAPAVAVKPPEPETVPPPTVAESGNGKPADAAIVAAPDPVAGMEMFPQPAQVTQLRIVKLAELDQDTGRQALLKDLRKEPAYRMESPCKDSLKAFDRLKAALTASGIGLVIDQTAQARMTASARLTKLKTNFVLYVEDVTPEELVQLLQHAAVEDRKAEKTKKGDTQFEAVVVNAMTDADREELCKLLGVKAKKLPDPPATGPLGVDVRKPLSEKTGDDIAKTLTGQGGVPRPEPGKSPVKPPERLALAMPYNPVRPRPDSPEIKRFLAARKPPRPGTVQVLLVLREMGG
jgi:hypothetical protein